MITRASDSSPARLKFASHSPDFENTLLMTDNENEGKIDSPSTRSEPSTCAHTSINLVSNTGSSETSSLSHHQSVGNKFRNGGTNCDCSAIANSNFILYQLASSPLRSGLSMRTSMVTSSLIGIPNFANATCKVGFICQIQMVCLFFDSGCYLLFFYVCF